jgi:hypothetical protein
METRTKSVKHNRFRTEKLKGILYTPTYRVLQFIERKQLFRETTSVKVGPVIRIEGVTTGQNYDFVSQSKKSLTLSVAANMD